MNLAEVSLRRPVFATMIILALMVFGMLSYPKVGVDLFPNVEFPFVTVTVVYPGTDPATMEREVAEPIEEAVNTLGGIRALRSTNQEGVTFVILEFELEVSADQAVQDVRDRIARVQNQLPAAADPPLVDKFDVGAAPVMTLSLSGALPARKLTQVADKIVKERIQRVRGVGGVDLVGGREREIHVYVDPDRLSGHGVTVTDISQAISAQNIEVPAGSFKSGSRELTVKTKGQVGSADEIADLLIPASPSGLRIRDVARVVDGMEEAKSASFLDGQSSISLVVKKQSGTNTVALAHAVHAAVEELKPRLEKLGATLTVPTDNSVFIERSIEDVQFDIVFGGILAIIVIFFFLVNFRATFISAIAIPTSLIATFAFIQWMGFTFNNMTMLALSLAIGILIDDAIVVMENIHRHLEMGKSAMQAAADATSEIFLAVLAMTSTILAVFVPVAVMKGIIGRFFMQFGLTVSFAVAISMLVSFTLTPVMSSKLLSKGHGTGVLSRAMDAVMGVLESAYGKTIEAALRHKIITLSIAGALLVGSGVLMSKVPAEFLPPEDRAQFSVHIELPTGTKLEKTAQAAEAVASDLRNTAPGVVHTLTTIGGGSQGQSNKGEIRVSLIGSKARSYSQQQLMAWIRDRYSSVKGALITVADLGMFEGGGRTEPIQFGISGDNLDEMVTAADALVARLRKEPGFVDVDHAFRGGKPEVAIKIDRERAASFGVPIATIASTIRAFMAGDAVSELKDGADAYDISVRLPPAARDRIESLASLQVRSTSGQLVDLSNLVTANRESGPSIIERQNRQRQIMVFANLQDLPLGTAKQRLDAIAKEVVPAKFETSHEGMAKIMTESFLYMVEALILAIILVYMILAAQFNSFVQPITLMVSLPLSVIGAFSALYLSGMTLSIFSMIGIIMLMGIVTKNAILLVDFANQERERGTSVNESLIKAGRLRLRPILMTSISMVFGMLPVALAISEGGEVRAPMAVCVIGGLITSTLLTLVVVPVIYTYIDRIVSSRILRWLGGKIFTQNTGEPANGILAGSEAQ